MFKIFCFLFKKSYLLLIFVNKKTWIKAQVEFEENEYDYDENSTEDQDENGEEDEMNEITEKISVGVCAMSKKVNSKPMGEILNRLHNYDHFEIEIFNEELILNKPITEWPKCDCLISFYSKDFPLKKVQEYKNLYNPFLINDLDKQW